MELSDNKISGNELKHLPIYENLRELRLANTRIESFDDIKNLAKFKNLYFLELEESPLSKFQNYREKIFEILPNIMYLDAASKDGQIYRNGINQ